jgi:transposase-like protein
VGGRIARREGRQRAVRPLPAASEARCRCTSEQRDEHAAKRFLIKAIHRHGVPEKITIDGSAANAAAIKSYNVEHGTAIAIRKCKYLHNVVDEVFLTIHGERHYLWRAVDQEDNVLDILVQSRWNKQAAKKFFCKLLKGCQCVPRVIITDKLQSYGAAKREILPGVEHRQSRYRNNRCENSHRPTRQREYRMQGFKWLCRKFCSGGHAGAVAPVCREITWPRSRTVRPQCGSLLRPLRPSVFF